MHWAQLVLGLSSLATASFAQKNQVPFINPAQDEVFASSPVESLNSLGSSYFTRLVHPEFPSHSVRIKRSLEICDKEVSAFSGYLDIQARHLFFYFFESRNDPENDDLMMWINGGPGCSSSLGLFMELGPCQILDEKGPQHNPYSWTNNASVFWLDQPIGVGFSYADYGEIVSSTEEAAKDVAAFIAIFHHHFSKFKGRAFHMAGESYGGRYLPVFASEIVDQNKALVKAGWTPINLQSIMIGNGCTSFPAMSESYFDMACSGISGVLPVLDISTCVRMKRSIPRCKKWIKEECVDRLDEMNCNAANAFCSAEIEAPYFESGRNPYNIAEDCSGTVGETLCYPLIKHINDFLNNSTTRANLGVDPIIDGFESCSGSVGERFMGNLDMYRWTPFYVAGLLERGIRVLLYIGTYDWICNFVGNERWSLDLEWSGHDDFNAQPLKEWKVDGKVAGKWRSARGLTYATVNAAGHMVPYDKPAEALAMVNRWLYEKEL